MAKGGSVSGSIEVGWEVDAEQRRAVAGPAAGPRTGTYHQRKLHRWARQEPDRRFRDLFKLVCDRATLVVAWERVAGNRGARTAGVDAVTRHAIERHGVTGFLEDLRVALKDGTFGPGAGLRMPPFGTPASDRSAQLSSTGTLHQHCRSVARTDDTPDQSGGVGGLGQNRGSAHCGQPRDGGGERPEKWGSVADLLLRGDLGSIGVPVSCVGEDLDFAVSFSASAARRRRPDMCADRRPASGWRTATGLRIERSAGVGRR